MAGSRSREQRLNNAAVNIQTAPIINMALEPGIQLIGFNKAESGLGEACRLTAAALHTAAVPFHILSCDAWTLARPSDLAWAACETPGALHRANLLHFNPDMAPHICGSLGAETFAERLNIGYWHWELPSVPESWAAHFNLLHEVWTPSPFVRDVIAAKSPIPVLSMPPGIPESSGFQPGRAYFGLPQQPLLFLTMFDALSFTERKNPHAALAAFIAAFGRSPENAALIIKVSNSYASGEPMERLRAQIAGCRNVHLLDMSLSRIEIHALIDACDIYVSLHRAEGFGLTMAEAMAMGKPVIGTNWSGNTAFMDAINSCPIQYQLVPVGQQIGPYEAHQLWAEPDIEHAAYWMRTLLSDTGLRLRMGAAGRHTIASQFSPAAAGARMRERLHQLGAL
ncbi:glycosyltransferase family 4 protein [Paenibacillus oenotherae]|nr:glycosyltransferase family 4 protein [Paenibacillus oenotherae]